MAHTKRKRRNKHRGNAVGVVEARGRTSKPRPGAVKTGNTRTSRGVAATRPALRPPTMQGAAVKALIGSVILFIFFRFIGGDTTTSQALVMCGLAFLLYTPLMFVTDKWIYKRKLRQQGGAAAGGRR